MIYFESLIPLGCDNTLANSYPLFVSGLYYTLVIKPGYDKLHAKHVTLHSIACIRPSKVGNTFGLLFLKSDTTIE